MPTPKLGLHKVIGRDGSTFWTDTRYFPMASIRVFGKPTMVLATAFEAWLTELVDYAATRQEKVIVVNDFSRSSVPPPDVRKAMADQANRLNSHPGFGYWVPVVPNPLLRGVLTAVLWMVEDDEKRTFYTTGLVHGIRKTLELYESIGHPLPSVIPEDYDFPEPPG